MTKLRMLLVLAASISLLCACGRPTPPSPILPEDADAPATNVLPGPDASEDGYIPGVPAPEDDTLPPHDGMLRSRLTNEWVEAEVANTRPIAVMTPNEKAAIPHYNLSQASVLYEANVENRMTRLMAIYEDWENLEKIGNIRSLRAYYAYWAFEWDACIVHFGGPFFINELIAEPTTQNLDGTLGGAHELAFFRSDDRPMPHNAYISGDRIADAMNRLGYSAEYRSMADEHHYHFTGKANPNTLEQYGADAANATYIDMSGCYPLTRCYFEYNENDGLYYRSQHLSGSTDAPHTDASGTQLSFKNILVQYTRQEDLGEGYLAIQCHDTTRDGWFFTNGKGVHVTWEKTSDYGATRYYDDNGNEITLNTGKTMVCIVEEGDSFTYR